MGPLTPVLTAITLATAASSRPVRTVDRVAQWRPIVAEASARFRIPAGWIERVIRAESGGLTTIGGRLIRSKVGAIGLMQVMPSTWVAMRAAYRLGSDPDDPRDNILAGTAYLRLMVDRFGYPGAIAAYNAGPERYAAYLAGKGRLPAETVAYLRGVTGGQSAGVLRIATPPRKLLFALRRDLADAPAPISERHEESVLFAIRNGLSR